MSYSDKINLNVLPRAPQASRARQAGCQSPDQARAFASRMEMALAGSFLSRQSSPLDTSMGMMPMGALMTLARIQNLKRQISQAEMYGLSARHGEVRPMPKAPVPAPGTAQAGAAEAEAAAGAREPGKLAKRFESGHLGAGTVSYDRMGGTSYGSFQISSKQGTMDAFLDFLDEKAPDWSRRLRAAGPADTGGRTGAMPDVWKQIASEAPRKFDLVQRAFIGRTHYDPAREMVLSRTGVDMNEMPPAMREVLFSTSVQHGATGAANIFTRALESVDGNGPEAHKELVRKVYDIRSRQFDGSTQRVQEAVMNRFAAEQDIALAMLDGFELPGLA